MPVYLEYEKLYGDFKGFLKKYYFIFKYQTNARTAFYSIRCMKAVHGLWKYGKLQFHRGAF